MREHDAVWNEGYISEIDYIHGYFSELSPPRLHLALLSRGVAHSMSRTPNYLELGYGQGLTLAIHAATSSGAFYGTDFNPSQAANAQQLAEATSRRVKIFEDSFEDLVGRQDLPQFDVIALHGIWSWIPSEARQAILDLAKTKLKPGGVLYVSYNTTPGWSPVIPLRQLLSEYSRRCATGGILSKVDASLAFVEKVIDSGAAYFQQNPSIAQRLQAIKSQDRAYVAHEYFNRHWLPMSTVEVFDAFAEAKMDFGASANILDNIESISVPEQMREILSGVDDLSLREMIKDYGVSQQFRRDIFVKGARYLTRGEMFEAILEHAFILTGDLDNPPKVVRTANGEATLLENVYQPLYTALGKTTGAPFSVGTLRSELKSANLNEWQIWEALLVLAGIGFVAPASRSVTPDEDAASARALNQELCRRSAFTGNIQFLAAPKISGASSVSRIEQLFILGEWSGAKDPAAFAASTLETQGERVVVEGTVIDDSGAMHKHLTALYDEFKATKAPMLKRIGVF